MATYPLKSPHLPLSFFGQIFCLPSPRLWRHALGLCFLVTLLGLGLNWRLLGFTSSEASPLALTLILFVIFLATLARLGFGGVTLFLVFSASLLLYLPASIDLSLPLYFWLLPLFLFWMSALSANLDVGLYRNWKGQSLFFLGAGVFLCVLAGHHTPYFFIFIVTLVLYLICAPSSLASLAIFSSHRYRFGKQLQRLPRPLNIP